MVRMGGSYSINVQSMVEILRKDFPKRKYIDRHMVYNIRLRARCRKLELKAANVEILANPIDVSFIKDSKFNSNNYSKGIFFILYYSCCLIM